MERRLLPALRVGPRAPGACLRQCRGDERPTHRLRSHGKVAQTQPVLVRHFYKRLEESVEEEHYDNGLNPAWCRVDRILAKA
jgi:hypothetical protein